MIKKLSPFASKIFKELNIFPGKFASAPHPSVETLVSINPHNNAENAHLIGDSLSEYKNRLVNISHKASRLWEIPLPKRGDVIRQVGVELRKNKPLLASLITLETGKIISESLGEVQEFIDMCDFTGGLSRQIGGALFPSERKQHSIIEAWHPLGVVGVISAFNFPAAVFGWNFCLSFLCGNSTIWKGAPSTPLTTYAFAEIIQKVLKENNIDEEAFNVFYGGKDIGHLLAADHKINLLSFTGSTEVGRSIGVEVQKRFGKVLLELGGNNPVIVGKDANLELALKACSFAALGTTAQRCTTLRRLFVHEDHYEAFKSNLISIYKNFKIGDPMDPSTNIGPLHNRGAIDRYFSCLKTIQQQGGKIITGGRPFSKILEGNYVEPAIIEIAHEADIVQIETFAPILYLFKFKNLEEAIRLANSVPQGLSASLFSNNLKEMFRFIGPYGAYTGLANVNVGTSGAEIGGAFGGEKETGGGRESGSDSWKQYMRRVTCTINYGDDLPLSQGINFEIKLNP